MNVGSYVRTKTGIHKIFRINKNATVWKYDCDKKPTGDWDSSYEYIKIREEDIIGKPSENPIDLVDYDDVLRIIYQNEDYICKVVNVLGNKGVQITDNLKVSLGCVDIKSIVTKQQFESMEYRIGE